MYVLILFIGVSSASGNYKIINSYTLRSQCDKALRYEQHQSPKDKFACVLKSSLPTKADKVLRNK